LQIKAAEIVHKLALSWKGWALPWGICSTEQVAP